MIFSWNIATTVKATAPKKVFSCDLGLLLIFGRIRCWRNQEFECSLGLGGSTVCYHWPRKEKELNISAFFGFCWSIICFLELIGHGTEAHLSVEIIFHSEF